MARTPIARYCTLIGALAALTFAAATGEARGGEFVVGNCQADPLSFGTRAFEDFATRGMKITRTCNPEGSGLIGLVTTNAVGSGRVARGARADAIFNAPPGTYFTKFRWAGTTRRRDCSYALQLFADGPGIEPVLIMNLRANEGCPQGAATQAAGYRSHTYQVPGATRIVQRVKCMGSGADRSCSARSSNYIRTYKASIRIVDGLAPGVAVVADTPLSRGEWVGGNQPLNYDASDNVGVRIARAIVADQPRALHLRPCIYADREGTFADRAPCPNGPGQMTMDTRELVDGTQALFVQAEDTAGNLGNSAVVPVRIDNAPPGRVDTNLEGGSGWRNANDFALGWANPPEGDRAPIVAANYQLCRKGGGECIRAERLGADIARFNLAVPAPGEWSLSMWRRDAAGNQEEDNASVPVLLRYDPEPPQLGFEPPPSSDPTRLSVLVTDQVSGLADGAIEISREGSGTWQSLATEKRDTRLTARVEDAGMPAGTYLLRARAYDQARNENSTDRRLDGQPMVLTLPLRIASSMRAGVERKRTVWRTIKRHGKRHKVRRHVTVLSRVARVPYGRRVQVAGRIANRDGEGIAGAQIEVFSATRTTPEQLVGVLQTDQEGRYRYTAKGSSSRSLRFAYAGTPLILPAERKVKLRVPATSSMQVSRQRVLNGDAVTFRGKLRGLPVPADGKLVELQVYLSGRWQTFRTTRADQAGGWAIRYRFKRTRGVQHFRFRASLPREAGYAFEAGATRSLTVRVRGQ
jgi:hypothetical protein